MIILRLFFIFAPHRNYIGLLNTMLRKTAKLEKRPYVINKIKIWFITTTDEEFTNARHKLDGVHIYRTYKLDHFSLAEELLGRCCGELGDAIDGKSRQ